ncbi:MAG: hypothetical protein ACK5ZV_01985 [bacterium]
MRAVVAVCLAVVLAGCHPAPKEDFSGDARLGPVVAAAEAAIAQVRDSGAEQWRAGWAGNAMVNVFGGGNRGLCWHWQVLVYQAVAEAAERAGLAVMGINAHVGRMNEHHAVVVFDPAERGAAGLLRRPLPSRAWVIDAWLRGRADVYRLEEWVEGIAKGPERVGVEELRGQGLPVGE